MHYLVVGVHKKSTGASHSDLAAVFQGFEVVQVQVEDKAPDRRVSQFQGFRVGEVGHRTERESVTFLRQFLKMFRVDDGSNVRVPIEIENEQFARKVFSRENAFDDDLSVAVTAVDSTISSMCSPPPD